MKSFSSLFIAFLLLQYTSLAQEGWFEQTSGTTNHLWGISFTDSNKGTVVGENGTILRTTNGGTTWISQTSGTTNWLWDVNFTDANTGTAVGDVGIILRTTDGGTSWSPQTSGTNNGLSSVDFVDQNTGWAVGDSGTILTTTDGGINWIPQTSGTSNGLSSVDFVDQNTGWAVEWNLVLKTTNGGINWFTQGSDTLGGVSVHFVDQNVGWTAGGFYGLGKTTDGGVSWTGLGMRPCNITSICFVDESVGWMVGRCPGLGYYGVIWKTMDGGGTIIDQYSLNEELYAVHFINQNTGWAVGEGGVILKTTTGGVIPVELTSFTASASQNKVTLNWTTATETNNSGFEIERRQDSEWERIGFVEGHGTTTESEAYLFVDDISNITATAIAYRLKQLDFDGSFEYSDAVYVENISPVDFALHQNFPNPFNPTTTIKYSLPVKSQVNLVVFNSLGQEVKQLVNEAKEAGKYTFEVNASNWPSGIYFYRLQAGEFVETKKMILLK